MEIGIVPVKELHARLEAVIRAADQPVAALLGPAPLPAVDCAAAPSPGPGPECRPARHLVLCGKYWKVSFDDQQGCFKDSVGWKHLARLLSQPNRTHEGPELAAAASKAKATRRRRQGQVDSQELATMQGSLNEEMLDQQAVREYAKRLKEILQESEKAQEEGDTLVLKELEEEKDTLLAHLKDAGVGADADTTAVRGRRHSRRLGPPNTNQRAAEAVCKALNRAIKELGEEMPNLKRHLQAHLHKGIGKGGFMYCPPPDSPRWALN
jgi:hypothetical protein